MSLFNFSPAPPTLSDTVVYLRPGRPGDWREWATLREQSRDFLVPWEPTWAPDAHTREVWLRRMRRSQAEAEQDTGYSFLIFRADNDRLAGGISLNQVRRGISQSGTLGYWMGQAHARQGLMQRAVQLVLKHGFTDLNLHRIEAGCVPHNDASANLLLKAGFREEGYARQYLRINGQWADHRMFGMLREDFEGCK